MSNHHLLLNTRRANLSKAMQWFDTYFPFKAMSLHKLAKLSIIFGILSGVLGIFTAIPSIICGHLYLARIKRNPAEINEGYKRMAVGGLIFGYFGFTLWMVIMILLWRIFMSID